MHEVHFVSTALVRHSPLFYILRHKPGRHFSAVAIILLKLCELSEAEMLGSAEQYEDTLKLHFPTIQNKTGSE